jgi:hypothetical protein
MDVERTLKRFPPSKKKTLSEMILYNLLFFKDYAHSDRIELQEELIIIIIKLLRKHDHLNYYQVNYLIE